jgi:hemoglobin
LHQWAGGDQAIRRLIDSFYDRVEGDDLLSPFFPGGVSEDHRAHVLLSLAADDAGLPDDPEFRSALVAYVEWGTRLAMHNSQPGAEVVEHAPVPRWGWGEASPFEP